MNRAVLVKIDPEFEALIPNLRAEELAQLKQSILSEGCRDNLRVWMGQNILLDGHNRYRICKEHKLDFGVTQIELGSREAALLWIEKNQLARRNITDAYRKTLIQNIAEREARRACKARATKAGEEGGNGRKKQENSLEDENVLQATKPETVRTRKKIAEETGVSEHALKQAKIINDNKDIHPEVFAKVRDGEITSLAQAVREIERPELDAEDITIQRKSLFRVLRAANALARAMNALSDLDGCDRGSIDLVVDVLRRTKPSLEQTISRLESALAANTNQFIATD